MKRGQAGEMEPRPRELHGYITTQHPHPFSLGRGESSTAMGRGCRALIVVLTDGWIVGTVLYPLPLVLGLPSGVLRGSDAGGFKSIDGDFGSFSGSTATAGGFSWARIDRGAKSRL
jgi:hypothetical protein